MSVISWGQQGARQYPHIRVVGGGKRRILKIRCSRCHTETDLPLCPVEVVHKNMMQRGWSEPCDPKRVICPACAQAVLKEKEAAVARKPKKPDDEKPVLTPGQKRAAWCRIESVKPKEKPPVKEDHLDLVGTVKADPPRKATPDDRRRIHVALEDHYDDARKCYKASFNDAAMAEKLKVPRAWVAEVREFQFGPNVNATTLDGPVALAGLLARYETLIAAHLDAAAKLEADANALKVDHAKVVARINLAVA